MPGLTEQQQGILIWFEGVSAIGEYIRGLGQVPSGSLYTQVMNHFSLKQYNRMITHLVQSGLVKEEASHMLVWIGSKEK